VRQLRRKIIMTDGRRGSVGIATVIGTVVGAILGLVFFLAFLGAPTPEANAFESTARELQREVDQSLQLSYVTIQSATGPERIRVSVQLENSPRDFEGVAKKIEKIVLRHFPGAEVNVSTTNLPPK
jgi:hypothetical protein